MTQCKKCGADVLATGKFCSHCGKPYKRASSKAWWVLALLFIATLMCEGCSAIFHKPGPTAAAPVTSITPQPSAVVLTSGTEWLLSKYSTPPGKCAMVVPHVSDTNTQVSLNICREPGELRIDVGSATPLRVLPTENHRTEVVLITDDRSVNYYATLRGTHGMKADIDEPAAFYKALRAAKTASIKLRTTGGDIRFNVSPDATFRRWAK
jgi:hypothetical protein